MSEITKIGALVEKYKAGEMDFDEVIRRVPGLEWGTRHEEAGEIWWEGENTVGDVDILWYEGTLTDTEREEILSALL